MGVAADKVPVAYAPAPAYHKPAPYVEEKLPPQPFAYEYGVADDYSKANFKKSETQWQRCCLWKLRDCPSRRQNPDHHLHRCPRQRIRRRCHLRGNPSLPTRAQGGIRTCPSLQGPSSSCLRTYRYLKTDLI